jgi:hypothetical protein
MAKSKKKSEAAANREQTLATAMDCLRTQLGYEEVERVEVESEPCAVAHVKKRPTVLVYVPDHDGPVTPTDEEMAVQLAAVVAEGPADYVWSTTSGKLAEGYIYSWLPEKECQVSEIPAAAETKAKGRKSGRAAVSADPVRFKSCIASSTTCTNRSTPPESQSTGRTT